MRVIFMGTPDFAVPTLELLARTEEVVAVFTQPDRRAGRGKKTTPPPVKRRALDLGLQVYQPESLRSDDVTKTMVDLSPDLIVVVAYGQILPKRILDLPPHGAINVHASLLPKLRGAAPIHRAILEGFKTTGVTTMLMDEGLDTGPMLLTRSVEIDQEMTAGELHDVLMVLGAQTLEETLVCLREGRLEPVPQEDDEATYAAMLTKEEGYIDFTRSAVEIERHIRGLFPWPMAWATHAGERVKIHAAKVLDLTADGEPGEILSLSEEGMTVVCGSGCLQITKLQFPGSRAMNVADYLRGHDLDGSRPLNEGE